MTGTMVGPARRQPPGPWSTLYERIDVAQRTCSMDGCARRHVARGLCKTHYDRWRKYGDPLAGAMERGSIPFCTVDGCERPYRCAGMCELHYDRWRRLGRVDLIPHPPAIDRFWANVEPSDGCWTWTGPISLGYGRFTDAGRGHPAHRWLYEYLNGTLPKSLDVDHLCHNADPDCRGGSICRHRRCVNPSHLGPATRRENTLRGKGGPAQNARKTHCPRGHDYDRVTKEGYRGCSTCAKVTNLKTTERRRREREAQRA